MPVTVTVGVAGTGTGAHDFECGNIVQGLATGTHTFSVNQQFVQVGGGNNLADLTGFGVFWATQGELNNGRYRR